MPGETLFLPLVAAIAAAMTPSTPPPVPAAQAPLDVVKAQADRMARMTVPVHIDGRGPFTFVVDTGSQATVLSSEALAEMGLQPTGQVKIAGIVGSASVPTVVLNNVTLGRTTHQSVFAPLLERKDIGADGIVGIDGLLGQRLLLDFANNRVEIAGSKAAQHTLGFDFNTKARRGYRNLMITTGYVDGRKIDVIIDTGANVSIGNEQLRRMMSEKTEWKPAVVEAVTGEKTLGEMGLASRLTLGKANFTRIPITFIKGTPFAKMGLADRPALLMGMRELRLFKRIAIDFRANRVLFDMPENDTLITYS